MGELNEQVAALCGCGYCAQPERRFVHNCIYSALVDARDLGYRTSLEEAARDFDLVRVRDLKFRGREVATLLRARIGNTECGDAGGK